MTDAPDTDPNPDDDAATVLRELRQLVEKSVSANARQLQNGAEILRSASRQKISVSQLNRSRDVVRNALEDYLRMSTRHASRLIDLGVQVSNHLANLLAAGQPAPTAPPPAPRIVDVALQGRPGDECQAAFLIRCDRSHAVDARFRAGLFVDEAGDQAVDIPVRFEPPHAVIEPGESQQFVLGVAVPADLPAGRYSTLVMSEAIGDVGLRLLLTVEAPKRKRAGKKKTASKTAKKKKTKKKTKKKAAKKSARTKTATKKRPTANKKAAGGSTSKRTASKSTTKKKKKRPAKTKRRGS